MKPCFSSAEILLPDFSTLPADRWAVVACDQFTSEPAYWEDARQLVADSPSTLHMILPEAYLSESEVRIPTINRIMEQYVNDCLHVYPDAMILTKRTQSDGSVRTGLVLAVDLEAYDYKKGAASLIRATEATVLERIPPRVAIRRDAPIELPHIMLLIDDPKGTVLEPLLSAESDSLAYDTDLMLGGGHLTGYFLSKEQQARLCASLTALITPEGMGARYGDPTLAPLLFAVGDGNHSLATAKAAYEEIKEQIGVEATASHPARYALAEVVNIHDPALKFEPIFRVMFGIDPQEVLASLSDYLEGLHGSAAAQSLTYCYASREGVLSIPSPVRQLTVGTLQDFIDDYLRTHPKASVDYIHGEESTRTLAKKENAIGFLFSGMEKSDLFRTVIFDGALPRKTFSMGHAQDKRYYMECRAIKKA